jgi:putative two-component system response regulator
MNDMTKILIVDDNRTSLALMDMLARKLPNCTTLLSSDAAQMPAQLDRVDFDAAIIDHRPPARDAIDLTRRIRASTRHADKPVVIVTSGGEAGLRQAALDAGVTDVLQKPFKPIEFRASLKRLARPSLSTQPAPPAGVGGRSQSGLEEELISAFTRAAGYKDRELPLHPARMALYCSILARHLGLSDRDCAELRLAAPLHDIGKMGLNDEVLQNRGILSPQQRKVMAEHTLIGHAILSTGRTSVMRLAADIALTHHERWDGSGYPRGLKGEQIPLAGRIAAVADVFDALTSIRPYKCAWTVNNAFDYLAENAGAQFDPRCVGAFQDAREEVVAVMTLMPDVPPAADADAA